jgi:EGF-like domain
LPQARGVSVTIICLCDLFLRISINVFPLLSPSCKVGWMGADCSKCHPYPGCKNGDCRRPWECNCQPGYGGMLCDEELNFCEKNPGTCQNGGECRSLTLDDGLFKCACSTGYRGRNCEIPPFTTTNAPLITSPATTEKAEAAVTEATEDEEVTTLADGLLMTHLNETIGGHRDYLEEDFQGADDLDNEA